jgi:LysR family nod box-dependent transcriptional activator
VHEPSVDEWFLQQGRHIRRVAVVAPTFALVPLLVVGTSRLATIWSRLARMAVKQYRLKILPMPVEIPAFCEVLQWPVHRDAEPGTVWLPTLMAEVAGSMRDVSR